VFCLFHLGKQSQLWTAELLARARFLGLQLRLATGVHLMADARQLETAEQIAAVLNVSPKTVKTLARAGRIPRVCLSRTLIRYDREAVLAALNNSQASESPSNAS
jgi:excisionase family DNA binding protein